MISGSAEPMSDPAEIAVATRDADDEYLIALAREHDVVWIVAGDDDLLDWEEQLPPIIAPRCVRAMADKFTV